MDTDYQAGYSGLRYAVQKGVGVVVMEPLKGGRLAKNLPPEMQAVFDAQPEGWTPAEWALRYVWNEPGVSLLLSGMNDPTQLEENLRVADRGLREGILTTLMSEDGVYRPNRRRTDRPARSGPSRRSRGRSRRRCASTTPCQAPAPAAPTTGSAARPWPGQPR